jgi:hypothetical protein
MLANELAAFSAQQQARRQRVAAALEKAGYKQVTFDAFSPALQEIAARLVSQAAENETTCNKRCANVAFDQFNATAWNAYAADLSPDQAHKICWGAYVGAPQACGC